MRLANCKDRWIGRVCLSPGVNQGRLSLTGAETQADPVQPREEGISCLPTLPSRGEGELPLAESHIVWNLCIFQHEIENKMSGLAERQHHMLRVRKGKPRK